MLCKKGFAGVAVVKNPLAGARAVGDMGSIPGLGESPGGEHGSPLQYSCLEKPMDRGAWRAAIQWSQRAWPHTLCRESGSAGNVPPRGKCLHDCWRGSPNLRGPEKWNSNWSWGLDCFPVWWLRVLGDSSSGRTLPTAFSAQDALTLP